MKKIGILAVALFTALGASAYGEYRYLREEEMTEVGIITLLVIIAYIVLSIVVLVRWWKMTKNIEAIREQLMPENSQLTYLVAIGEPEKAHKAAVKLLVDDLYPIYFDQLSYIHYSKAKAMNELLEPKLPKIQQLGITLPEYITSGEKFIDYMNGLTNSKVPY